MRSQPTGDPPTQRLTSPTEQHLPPAHPVAPPIVPPEMPAGTRKGLPVAAVIAIIVLVVAGGAGAAVAIIAARHTAHALKQAADQLHTTITESEAETPPATTSGPTDTTEENSEDSESAASGSTTSESTTQHGEVGLEDYNGPGYTAEVPAGWSNVENDAQKQGYVESKWQNPADPHDYVLIDSSPQNGQSTGHPESPPEQAAPVHSALQKEPGYEEVSYNTVELGDVQAQEWVFRVPGSERVDYFFQQCTNGFAVLGSTTLDGFSQLSSTFNAIARSVQTTCS